MRFVAAAKRTRACWFWPVQVFLGTHTCTHAHTCTNLSRCGGIGGVYGPWRYGRMHLCHVLACLCWEKRRGYTSFMAGRRRHAPHVALMHCEHTRPYHADTRMHLRTQPVDHPTRSVLSTRVRLRPCFHASYIRVQHSCTPFVYITPLHPFPFIFPQHIHKGPTHTWHDGLRTSAFDTAIL